jgi:hypothetical protein
MYIRTTFHKSILKPAKFREVLERNQLRSLRDLEINDLPIMTPDYCSFSRRGEGCIAGTM